MPLQPGDIVWIRAPDPNGVNEKLRPWVILRISNQLGETEKIFAVAITTVIRNPISKKLVIPPWDSQGRSKTKLRERSAAACDWIRIFESFRIESHAGHVPPDRLKTITQKIKELEDEFRKSK